MIKVSSPHLAALPEPQLAQRHCCSGEICSCALAKAKDIVAGAVFWRGWVVLRVVNLLICFVAALLTACSSLPSSLAPSSSPLPPCVQGSIPTESSDCQLRFLGLIPLGGAPNSGKALSKAKRKARVDVLTDVTIDHNYRWFILFSSECIRVDGLGVEKKDLKSACRQGSSYVWDE